MNEVNASKIFMLQRVEQSRTEGEGSGSRSQKESPRHRA